MSDTSDLPSLLNRYIRDILKKEFDTKSPTPDCFDYSQNNMDKLATLMGDNKEESARLHLLDCCRCRYIFCQLYGKDQIVLYPHL